MLVVLKWLLLAVLVLGAALSSLWVIIPKEEIDPTRRIDSATIGENLDAWLAEKERMQPGLRDGAQKQIIWAGQTDAQTPLSIVYLHGFSASAQELSPVPQQIAENLGANLYLSRLTGHGVDSDELGKALPNDWIDDLSEAIAIGRRIGERVILIGTSMGGALTAIGAQQSPDDLAGVVMLSPGFRLKGIAGASIEWPGARIWGPWLVGEERGFEPRNDAHAAHWTNRYPTEALASLGAVSRYARSMDVEAIDVPALFFVAQGDTVADPKTTRQLAADWGGPHEIVPVVMAEGDDPDAHVLAGDALSPGQTARTVSIITSWARDLHN
ncbi:alpha/beta hydrolase [Qingshengfaniella alkalisoli]|uniref:Alpha/beta fold hydrolase n=1 Tax=Qingshengfaniella alkalisoli TaxID=2599296 RepID=A0A5B8IVU9_9RHOB|nr:alpha/beta fold hydrolase [Qingshengfaniella alkalisoli]QDY69603.1 alpha/beta fold hydrolase [Qingshengfaniella alkalisoli]